MILKEILTRRFCRTLKESPSSSKESQWPLKSCAAFSRSYSGGCSGCAWQPVPGTLLAQQRHVSCMCCCGLLLAILGEATSCKPENSNDCSDDGDDDSNPYASSWRVVRPGVWVGLSGQAIELDSFRDCCIVSHSRPSYGWPLHDQ